MEREFWGLRVWVVVMAVVTVVELLSLVLFAD